MKYIELKAKIRGHLRFAVVAWAVAVPIMYAIQFWAWSNRSVVSGRDWRIGFAIPLIVPTLMLGGMYFAARGALKMARQLEPSERP